LAHADALLNVPSLTSPRQNTAGNLAGAIPKVGVSIPVVSVEGRVNVPARRRLLTTDEVTAAAQAAPTPPPAPEEIELQLPKQITSDVSPAMLAGLTRAGFWDSLTAILPPSMQKNLTALLDMTNRPAEEFLAHHNLSRSLVEEYTNTFTPDALGGVTVQQPQFPNPLQTTVIPFVARGTATP
jgi:hypothetical protein